MTSSRQLVSPTVPCRTETVSCLWQSKNLYKERSASMQRESLGLRWHRSRSQFGSTSEFIKAFSFGQQKGLLLFLPWIFFNHWIFIFRRSRFVFPCAFFVFNIFYWTFVNIWEHPRKIRLNHHRCHQIFPSTVTPSAIKW